MNSHACENRTQLMGLMMFGVSPGDHVRQDSMDFSKEWEDATDCRCTERLKPLERRKAREHQRCLAHSLVGTPNYIAPEVLLRTGTEDTLKLALLLVPECVLSCYTNV